jgi:hypothetical protein
MDEMPIQVWRNEFRIVVGSSGQQNSIGRKLDACGAARADAKRRALVAAGLCMFDVKGCSLMRALVCIGTRVADQDGEVERQE